MKSRLNKDLKLPNGIKPTSLYPKKEDAEKINLNELSKLTTPEYNYICTGKSDIKDHEIRTIVIKSMMEAYQIQERITLKVELRL